MTTPPKDPLAGDVSITAKLEASGLTLKAKSRFGVAVDRLLGALVDTPGSYFDGLSSRGRIRSDRKAAALLAENKAVEIQEQAQLSALEIASKAQLQIAQVRADALVEREAGELAQGGGVGGLSPPQARLLASDLLMDRARRFENRYAVASEAIELLQAAEATQDSQANERADGEKAGLDEDWLNVFGDYVEKATSDRLRSLWARVLAGEVRKPGAFSLRTLRFVSELDQETAQRFEKVARLAVTGEIPRPMSIEGDPLMELVELEDAGLIHGGGCAT
jgi:hypothetical protein